MLHSSHLPICTLAVVLPLSCVAPLEEPTLAHPPLSSRAALTAGEVDYYQVNAVEETVLIVEAESLRIGLFEASGACLANELDSLIEIVASGLYLVAITTADDIDFLGASMTVDDYAIEIIELGLTDPFEPNDTFESAALIEGPEFYADASVHPGDLDFYRIDVEDPEGARLELCAWGMLVGLFDVDGTPIGTGAPCLTVDSVSGSYIVGVTTEDDPEFAGATFTWPYGLSVAQVVPAAPPPAVAWQDRGEPEWFNSSAIAFGRVFAQGGVDDFSRVALRAYDALDGTLLWQADEDRFEIARSQDVAARFDLVASAVQVEGETPDGVVQMRKARDGALLWEAVLDGSGNDMVRHLSFSGLRLIGAGWIESDEPHPTVIAWGARGGRELWRTQLFEEPGLALGLVTDLGESFVTGARVVGDARDSFVAKLDRRGAVEWTRIFDHEGLDGLNKRIAVVGRLVYGAIWIDEADESVVFALDRHTGESSWLTRVSGRAVGLDANHAAVVVAGQDMIFVDGEQEFPAVTRAFHPATGELLWEAYGDSGTHIQVAVRDGEVLVSGTSWDGLTFDAYDLADGALLSTLLYPDAEVLTMFGGANDSLATSLTGRVFVAGGTATGASGGPEALLLALDP